MAAPESAEVVIVGGGAMGASVAFHLANLGVHDVVLLERESLASGSTSKSAGGIRAQFADELNIRIALRSMAEFEALDRTSGIEYKRHGYLFLLTSDDEVESFRAAVALQQSLGVPSRLISPEDVEAMIPALETSDLLAAAYCPIDGHASPESVVQAYAGAAAAHGARIRQGTSLDRIEVSGDEIVGVETSAGPIRTNTVVCTAGVWSRDVGTLAEVDIPVRGEARWMHFTPEDAGLPRELPLTIDFATGFYFHREGAGLVFGGREQAIEEVATHGTRRLAGSGRPADPGLLVGLLRDEPGPQRHRGRSPASAAVPLRHRLLRPWVPAGARRGRAPGRARRRRRALARPLPALARPLRPRRRAPRALRGLGAGCALVRPG